MYPCMLSRLPLAAVVNQDMLCEAQDEFGKSAAPLQQIAADIHSKRTLQSNILTTIESLTQALPGKCSNAKHTETQHAHVSR
jgi:hypothetical protein